MNSGPHKSHHTPTPHEPCDLQSNVLARIRDENRGITDALHVSVEHFQSLQGLSAAQVEEKIAKRESLPPAERVSLETLQSIAALTQEAMRKMNENHPGLPPDSLQTTLGLVTRPGASVVVLWGHPNADMFEPEQVLGYGIVIRGHENFPESEAADPEHRIPDVLLDKDSVKHRLIRLFVRDCAREQESAGRAFGLIIDRVKEICQGETIIGMVLMDLVCLEGGEGGSYDKQIWLEAKAALERRGFEDTGYGFTEVIATQSQTVVSIPFRWYTFPPRSDQGRMNYQAQQERFERLEAHQRSRLAGIVAQLPLSGAVVLHAGTMGDAFDIASLSANQVYGECLKSSSARPVRRFNLISWDSAQNLSLPHSSADAVVVNGVLPDVAGNRGCLEATRAVRSFIEGKVAALREGGTLLIRDTIAPPDRELIHLFVNNQEVFPWSGGKTLVELFEQFVSTRDERHIDQADWSATKRLDKNDGSLACFSVPANVAAEFLLKYLYSSDWHVERRRAYTTQNIDQRLQLGRDLGLRLVYAVPERNAFVLERHQGRVQ